jgi:hypothetical protein
MEAPHVVKRRDWLHSEARCPSCGLHLDPHRDLDDYIRVSSDTRATGAIVTHRRCGAMFRIEFAD